MSGSESEVDEAEGGSSNELKFIADYVLLNKIILEKSQTPAVKRKKESALTELVEKYEKTFGKLSFPRHPQTLPLLSWHWQRFLNWKCNTNLLSYTL
jgi:hypothetical protein